MNEGEAVTIMQVMDVFSAWFAGASWNAWRVLLKAAYALPLTDADLAIFQAATGRTTPPSKPCREVWCLIGRRGGKSVVAALCAVFAAFFRSYVGFVVPGEVATVMLIAADRRQARTLLRYIMGFIRNVPILAERLTAETKEGIEVVGLGDVRVVIEITTCSRVATRSYTLAQVCNDEVGYWPTSELAAQPDVEVLTAQRPGLATIPFSAMWNISTGYARQGALYQAHEEHWGVDDDPVLFWRAPSRSLDPECIVQMNPCIDIEVVRAAFEADPIAAAAEWNADFRSDVEKLFTVEMLDACTDFDRPLILPPDYEEQEVA